MKALLGVISEQKLRTKMLAIAAGKYHPGPSEPNIWFASLNAIGQILSNDNIVLLRLMDQAKPATISELARLSGRQVSNLSTTLKTLEGHGFVTLIRKGNTVQPIARYTDFEIHIESDWIMTAA
ncbi:MarR family transcriptional regulator [Shimwellia pseudoproteus]|uniref:HVO_A0114 family putative DNA-binding protein n=1 Tax=Shimwellia pseudoproteus TaxID=570012 RepID=UPI0018ECCE3C|nr:MarR family transcriptional regulator [Shimwellia pseudoproteus]MBJ3814976.1 MarR family transcriptional regulator [Shimwellia pseudoproteus]